MAEVWEMTLPQEQAFLAAISGKLGPAEQLAAFCECWESGARYVRLLKHSALGCSKLVSADPEIESELEALFVALMEVEAWFDRCGQDLKKLETTNPDKDRAIH